MAANTLQAFTNDAFGTVRTIEQEGAVYFCGRDVATALRYVNTKDALARHCKGVVKHYPLDADNGNTGSEPRGMTHFLTGHDLLMCLQRDLSSMLVPPLYR
ncbi:BRO family protein, partial [Corynebacterium striatum]|uniref:BRO family protein n=1 Tax=Corynebacterium striatum TaxID=43770 RepID=UPI003B59019E